MAEVFISYKAEERARAAPFATHLLDLGVVAWFDINLSAGEVFDQIIRKRLEEAKAVLVCWSPAATRSVWVKAEADVALLQGTYVPIFIESCPLPLPYPQIQTDDLSEWTGQANDPKWLKVVDRIAELIGRKGVSAAARAFASGDEKSLYDFAQSYPDEPTARKIWGAAEARYRESFARQMVEAKNAAEADIEDDRATLEASVEEAARTFEAWLVNEQRGAANGPMPNPTDIIRSAEHAKIAALKRDLAQAKAKEGERDSGAAALSARRAAASARQPRRWAITTLMSFIIGVSALIGLSYFRAQVQSLSAALASAHNSLQAADRERSEAQARIESLTKELEDARLHASRGGWFLVISPTFQLNNDAKVSLANFNQKCGNYKLTARILNTDETELSPKGQWVVALGPFDNQEQQPTVDALRACGIFSFYASARRP